MTGVTRRICTTEISGSLAHVTTGNVPGAVLTSTETTSRPLDAGCVCRGADRLEALHQRTDGGSSGRSAAPDLT